MSRRGGIVLLVVAVLVGGYFAVTGGVRAHVDGLIQHAVGKPLRRFTATDRAGRTWTAADLAGKRAVLHFFRSRCHSCEQEAAQYRELEANLPADVVLLHVMTDRLMGFPPELAEPTIAAKGFARPVLMADAAFADAFL
jgi:thiol-disulfide isomerase/thioredoxin